MCNCCQDVILTRQFLMAEGVTLFAMMCNCAVVDMWLQVSVDA